MRVQIDFRDSSILEQIGKFPQYEKIDEQHYCEVPGDTLLFFAAVAPLGRFELIPPHTRYFRNPRWYESGECWVVEFHNDYD